MPRKKKNKTPMDKLTQNYEQFIKGKELKEDGKDVFESTLKQAVPPKHKE